jgi:hypothetical protein
VLHKGYVRTYLRIIKGLHKVYIQGYELTLNNPLGKLIVYPKVTPYVRPM